VHGEGARPNEAVVGTAPEVWFGVRAEDIALCGLIVRGRGSVFRACMFACVACDAAGPEVGAGLVDGVAGPGVGAAVPGTGAAVPPVVFVDAARPDLEFCLFGAALSELGPAGQGVVVWPEARLEEIRNNHIIFEINFMEPPMKCCRLRFGEASQCSQCGQYSGSHSLLGHLPASHQFALSLGEKTTFQGATKNPTNKWLRLGWRQLACHKRESV
jgi:hypothetical protein